jgi:hypothetical protein
VVGPALDGLPGYRRRLRVTPATGRVMAELEDDNHCMAVTLEHADGVITDVRAEQDRAPWTTCGGAMPVLRQTFEGVRLSEVARRGEKTANCTHLYDLVELAAAHAGDAKPTVFDILAADPVAGRRAIELRRNGETVMRWAEDDGRLTEPADLAGLTLFELRPWIDSLDARRREEARVLRWGAIVATGRLLPFEEQSDATRMAPSCYSFQPQRAVLARRIGEVRDFSTGSAEPLDRRGTRDPQPAARPPRAIETPKESHHEHE